MWYLSMDPPSPVKKIFPQSFQFNYVRVREREDGGHGGGSSPPLSGHLLIIHHSCMEWRGGEGGGGGLEMRGEEEKGREGRGEERRGGEERSRGEEVRRGGEVAWNSRDSSGASHWLISCLAQVWWFDHCPPHHPTPPHLLFVSASV